MPEATGLPEVDPPEVDLVTTFASLQSLTLTTPHVGQFLSEVANLAIQLGGPPLSCSVTLRRSQGPSTVASTDSLAEHVDEVQYDDEQGPCLEALTTGEIVRVDDQRSETRWPAYQGRALEAGVRSSLSLPLSVGGDTIGALNLYSTIPRAVEEQLERSLVVFAAQAAAALAMVARQDQQARVSAQLEQALASRATIDQALGILMAQQRCTADEAFALLRAHSQNSNRKIRDVAAALVQRVSGSAPKPGAAFAHSDEPSAASADGPPR